MTRRLAFMACLAAAGLAGCMPVAMPPLWSPDSGSVLFIYSTGSREGALYIVTLDDKSHLPRRLPAGRDASVSAAAWSIDGGRIYYAARSKTGSSVRACLPDGSGDVEVAPFPGEDIRWLAASPKGDELFAVAASRDGRGAGGALVAIDLGAGRGDVGSVEGAHASIHSPVLAPKGEYFVYATERGKGDERKAVVWKLPLAGGTAVELAALSPGPSDAPAAVGVSPDGKLVAAAGAELVIIPGGKAPLKRLSIEGVAVMVTVSPYGSDIHLGVVAGEAEPEARHLRVAWAAGTTETVERGQWLLGGRSYAPVRTIYAEHTGAGVRVAATGGKWNRDFTYPVSARQCLAAARGAAAAGRADEALTFLASGLESPYADAPPAEMKYEQSRLHLTMREMPAAKKAFTQAYLSYPEVAAPPRSAWLALMRKVRPLDERFVGALLAAEEAIDRGELDKADGHLKLAFTMTADQDCLGGILYRRARLALAKGERREAGLLYSRAADCRGFAQAAFAAARSAHAYASAGKLDLARERLLKSMDMDPKGAHASALGDALHVLRGFKSAGRKIVETLELPPRPRVWIERWPRFDLSLAPPSIARPAGSFEITARWIHGVSVETSRRRRRLVLKGAMMDLGGMVASPDGELIALGAGSAGQDAATKSWSTVLVIDREGDVVVGRKWRLASDEEPTGGIRSFRWSADGDELIIDDASEDEEIRKEVPR